MRDTMIVVVAVLWATALLSIHISLYLTSARFYQRQVKQNLKAVMQRLVERNAIALRDYLVLLIDDMGNDPALFD
jgi:hypothetical protein